MQIKYYSTDLNKYFDTEKELIKAEKENKEQQELIKKELENAKARKELLFKMKEEREKEIENAFEKANKLLLDFINDYGNYNLAIRVPSFNHMFNIFENF